MPDITSQKMAISSIHSDFYPMAPSRIFQIPLRVTIQDQIGIVQWVIVDEVVQFRLLRHGHIQCILDPGAVDGSKGFILFPEENKKSEPFSYREKVRIFIVWCDQKVKNLLRLLREPSWNSK